MLSGLLRTLVIGALAAFIAPTGAGAQDRGYSLAEIQDLVKGGVSASRIIELANRNCLTFRATDSNDAKLRQAGASNSLIASLRGSCRTGDASAPPPAPSPRTKTIIKHDTVVIAPVVKHDTVVMAPVVKHDTVVVRDAVAPSIPLRTFLYKDFRTDRDAYLIINAYCDQHFTEDMYSITTLATSPCDSYWKVSMPPAVRIQAEILGLGAAKTYAWGVEFGYDSTTNDRYTFHINNAGETSVWRQVSKKWEALLPYEKSSAIRTEPGSFNRLRVEIRETALTFFINDMPVAQYRAVAPVRGYAGVGIFGVTPGGGILVKSFRVDQIQ